MVQPRSYQVIYYFDTPALERKHQSFGRITLLLPNIGLLFDQKGSSPLVQSCYDDLKKLIAKWWLGWLWGTFQGSKRKSNLAWQVTRPKD